MREKIRADLLDLLEYLETAERRAEAAGDGSLQRDPEANRYASEAGSLLATIDGAVRRVREVIEVLDNDDDV